MRQQVLKLTREALKDWRRPAITALAAWAIAMAVHGSDLRTSIETYSSRRLEFSMRTFLHAAPSVSKKIRVISFDDRTLQWNKDSDLSRMDWGTLFTAIGKRKPRVIIVDKVFGVPRRGEVADVDPLSTGLKAAGNVVAGSFWSDTEIHGREPMQRTSKIARVDKAPWLPLLGSRFFYGPDPAIAPDFGQVGHLRHEGHAYIEAVSRISENDMLVYSGFLAAKKLEVTDDGFFVDGNLVPLNRDRQYIPNLFDPSTISNYSMEGVVRAAQRGTELKFINEDDIVIILPQMYTGNTDYKDTPAGRLPGGFFLVATANSVLNGNWLKFIDGGPVGGLLAAAAGGILGLLLSAIPFGGVLLCGTLGIPAIGIALFVQLGWVTDWIFIAILFNTTALLSYLYKTKRQEAVSRRAREALSGLVPRDRLTEIINDPSLVKFEPSEKVLTLMFIDIVGFSTVAETKTPQQVFSDLKEAISRITRIVHQFDGFVDRTLGDGLLCYFGYAQGRLASPTGTGMNHAEQAISCALEIQRQSVTMTLKSSGERPVFPLRIGINTAGVFLGDLGDGLRLDYTVIGHGVNFSQRLEAACEPYRVMISNTTHALAQTLSFRKELMRRRLIQIKHHKEYFEVFELIPVDEPHNELNEAQSIFNKSIGMNRVDQRWQVPESMKVTMTTEFGTGAIVNYSRSGFSIQMTEYLARGFQTTFSFDSLRESHHIQIGTIHGEVRWGRPLGKNKFLHGILVKNLNEVDTEIFLHQLHSLCKHRRTREDSVTVAENEIVAVVEVDEAAPKKSG